MIAGPLSRSERRFVRALLVEPDPAKALVRSGCAGVSARNPRRLEQEAARMLARPDVRKAVVGGLVAREIGGSDSAPKGPPLVAYPADIAEEVGRVTRAPGYCMAAMIAHVLNWSLSGVSE